MLRSMSSRIRDLVLSAVRPVRVPDMEGSKMGWMQAGFILFAFAAPSAICGVPYAIGMAGLAGGVLLCAIITAASVKGALMLLQMKILFPECSTMSDLGLRVMGRKGQIWGNIIQLGNFCLFMPCAMRFCALALQGVGNGIPYFEGCTDYYVLTIAVVCLLTTQVRTFTNTQILSGLSLLLTFGLGAVQIVAAYKYEKHDKVPAQWFGNPTENVMDGFIKAMGGITIASWAYVPSFLTVELTSCMRNPEDFRKSILLSGALIFAFFVILGPWVVVRWGFDLGEVISITSGVDAWAPGNTLNTVFNIMQLMAVFISYMLDSVPLGRYCQKVFNPEFADTWSISDNLKYLSYTLPTFLLALFLCFALPSVNVLLDFTTAFTVPWSTQIYPAVLYWRLFAREDHPALLDSSPSESVPQRKNMTLRDKLLVAATLIVGCGNFAICLTKAVGYVSIAELRPPMQIGCGSWLIWSSTPKESM